MSDLLYLGFLTAHCFAEMQSAVCDMRMTVVRGVRGVSVNTRMIMPAAYVDKRIFCVAFTVMCVKL